jgi:GNAT superfamily N-acetyltransferase
MTVYAVRRATADDIETIVHHRIAMFTDMRTPFDVAAVERASAAWLRTQIEAGTYRGWLMEDLEHRIVAGGGLTVIPWPPGPLALGGRCAFVYNIYVEPPHRLRGLARQLMDTIHQWCREEGITAVALNASREARHLYDTMGYVDAPSPMMWKVM